MAKQNKAEFISKQFKEIIKKKYDIVDMKLFGSSARGDYSSSSDIDIFIKLSKVNRKIEEELFDIAYDLELEHDCLIDVIIVPENAGIDIPLYQNIKKEGIAI
ncbi:MAG: nucleotidyltransferase domain-containing protein [Deltaproteobacteria bacterium]|nr:nucleotidyltransferase domain-containing protein [Deltaproteobacteria bacterium]